jgi:hypothetical protein
MALVEHIQFLLHSCCNFPSFGGVNCNWYDDGVIQSYFGGDID